MESPTFPLPIEGLVPSEAPALPTDGLAERTLTPVVVFPTEGETDRLPFPIAGEDASAELPLPPTEGLVAKNPLEFVTLGLVPRFEFEAVPMMEGLTDRVATATMEGVVERVEF